MDGKSDGMTSSHGDMQFRRGDALFVSDEQAGKDHPDAGAPNLDRLRTSIERTETELADTLDAIQDKLSVDRLLEKAEARIQDFTSEGAKVMKERMSRIADSVSTTASEAIRANPVPVALAAMGIGWLLVKSFAGKSEHHERRETLHESRELTEGVQISEAAPMAVHKADREKVRDEGYTAAEGRGERQRSEWTPPGSREDQPTVSPSNVSRSMESMRGRIRENLDKYRTFLEEQPAVVALSILAFGALIGLGLPESKREEEWMGEAGGNILRRTREKTREIREKARDRISRVIHEAQHAALGTGENPTLTADETRKARDEGWQS